MNGHATLVGVMEGRLRDEISSANAGLHSVPMNGIATKNSPLAHTIEFHTYFRYEYETTIAHSLECTNVHTQSQLHIYK